ncbi:ceramidase domain-containing protein [Lacimonas salitolerans]|uniref:Ceramidase domain-containing protein n=1 Tax=Lacimonas salitolerans TaxID=1323750 RepID=A0ABW4EHK8_9RHOB
MNFTRYIDLYCERTAPGFWNEPINALSNAAFLVAALLALRVYARRGRHDVPDLILILLAAAIGVGSFLFHTFATGWSELADVVPIWSFVAFFVLVTIYRLTGESPWPTARIAMIVLGSIGVVFWFTSGDVATDDASGPGYLNGSLQYLPALLALMIFSGVTLVHRHPARYLVTGAAITFLLSLIFRTIDLMTCAATGIGTHFMWHILNGVMVGLLLHALLWYLPARRAG